MLGMNPTTRGNPLKIFTDLFTAAAGRFNPGSVPILDAQVSGSFGVYCLLRKMREKLSP
jgi:hypothetical protein